MIFLDIFIRNWCAWLDRHLASCVYCDVLGRRCHKVSTVEIEVSVDHVVCFVPPSLCCSPSFASC